MKAVQGNAVVIGEVKPANPAPSKDVTNIDTGKAPGPSLMPQPTTGWTPTAEPKGSKPS